jgi:hypothetical protein
MLYHAPILDAKEVETDAKATDTINIKVMGGEPGS